MGMIQDYLTKGRTFDNTQEDGVNSPDKRLKKFLDNYPVDLDYPIEFRARSHIEQIGVVGGSAGTYTLTVDIRLSEPVGPFATFTTAPIAYDALDSVIEGAIDTAANGVVPGWTNGDIAVAGGGLNTDPVILAFSGNSVTDRANFTVIDVSLVVGGSAPTLTDVLVGQPDRFATGLLAALGYYPSSGGPDYHRSVPAPPPPLVTSAIVNTLVLRQLIEEAVYWDGGLFSKEHLAYMLAAAGFGG